MQMHKILTRGDEREDISRRSLSLRLDAQGRPASLDEEARTVEIVAATETASVLRWHPDTDYAPEILLMSGCRVPEQVPMLDTHNSWDVESVLGSVGQFRVEGEQLLAVARFSATPKADEALTKIKEGHLRDFSVGYRIHKMLVVKHEETHEQDGRTFTGPCLLAVDWEPVEESVCPIGADPNAKARAAVTINQEDKAMKWWKMMRKAMGMANNATREQVLAEVKKRGLPTLADPDVEVRDGGELDQPQDGDGGEGTRAAQPEPQAAPAGPAMDPALAASDAVRAERARAAEIRNLCNTHDCQDLGVQLIDEGKSVDEARQAVLSHLEHRPQGDMPGMRVEMGSTDKQKFNRAASQAIMMRGGIVVPETDVVPGARDLMGLTLREMARESLMRAGHAVPTNVVEMVGRALSSSDFPILLADSANTSLMAGYAAAPETWNQWCGTGNVSDFKAHTIARASEASDLEEIKEGGEYKHGDLDEAKETLQIATYGKLLLISRQAIINDDLGALTDIPFKHGESAARKVGDLPYAVLTANAAMSDGTALFASDHSNLAGTGAAPSVTTVGAGVAAMKKQKDVQGLRRLNIRPQFFVAPVALETAGEQLFGSLQEGTQAKPGLVNPYSGTYFTRVYDARLDDASATAWYLMGPKGKAVRVFFLNGVQTPYMEQRQGWNVDGTEFKVRIDACAAAVDFRTQYKNAGA